jgi:ABC-2 type transport system permease protein
MAMFGLVTYLAINQEGFGDLKKVLVVDESGWFKDKMRNGKSLQYSYTTNYAEAKHTFSDKGYDYLLYVPAAMDNVVLLGEKTPAASNANSIEDQLSTIARAHRLSDAHIDSAILANAQRSIEVKALQLTADGEKSAHIAAAQGVGLVCAFFIYLTLFLYGAQVMRGVIEEKVSRIVEVVISSVKPFQLMLGKIIGVGMVGLTQFVLWIVLSLVLSSAAGTALVGSKMKMVKEMSATQSAAQAAPGGAAAMEMATQSPGAGFLQSMESLPVTQIILCFLFYFLFGYLLYSALFAAVGSAVDNETETQQFMFPITMPLIFTIMVSQTIIVNNPDSAISVWLSMIPFTAPIAMMIRIPFHVPPIQIAASMTFMVLGFLFTTWVAGRIYRVGILMYGKKASYKELAKWFMYKD